MLMSTTDKCPHCGAGVSELCPAGFYLCGYSVGIKFHQSDLCRERAAHAKTRKELESLRIQFVELGQRYSVAEIASKTALIALTREREKWEKLREWANAYSHRAIVLWEMSRLDAEAKEGQ